MEDYLEKERAIRSIRPEIKDKIDNKDISEIYAFNRRLIEGGVTDDFLKENWITFNDDRNSPAVILAVKEAIIEKNKLIADSFNYAIVRAGSEPDYIRKNWIPTDGQIDSNFTQSEIERGVKVAKDIKANPEIYKRLDNNNIGREFTKGINKIAQLYYDKQKLEKVEREEVHKHNSELITVGARPDEVRSKWIPTDGDKNSAGSRAEISQAIVEIEERRGDGKYLKSDAKKTISKQSNIKI